MADSTPKTSNQTSGPLPPYTPGFFPVKGIDVSCEYGRQPAYTTPEGVNVRSFEPDFNRVRGGSREGLSKFIDDTVFDDVSEIQHLTVIVTTSPVALAAAVIPPEDFAPFYLTDPSTSPANPGRVIPFGGDGVMQGYDVTNVIQGFDEQLLQVGTIQSSGNNTVVDSNGSTVQAASAQGSKLPVGSRTVIVPIGGSAWRYSTTLWV
jgi:hypothetical protein